MVTFKTNNYRDVSMFAGDAHTLLGLMGVGIRVPGAVKAEQVPAALERLRKAIETHGEQPSPSGYESDDEDEEEEQPVLIKTRAFPLLELLSAAADANDYVIWE
ncbi:MAG: DUF1840 domain-containing protein [Gammaproteobacteria bacterium]|nr:DUF1840 domain-containing protein [Gammaproteobacteria bacterium]